MSSVLVSFIGVGKREEDPNQKEVYKRIRHISPYTHNEIITSISAYALLRENRIPISQIVFIGTNTSSWAALLEELADEQIELFFKIEEEVSKSGITDISLENLEKVLSLYWNVPVSCIAHTSHIDDQTFDQLFTLYTSIMLKIPQQDSDIVFDVTHGFRSMPLLMMAALQYRDIFQNNTNSLRLVYVELKNSEGIIREITPIYDQQRITRAVRIFIDKLEGGPLSEIVEKFWPRGAKTLRKFSITIQGNCVNDLLEFVRGQLKNSIIEGESIAFPDWFKPVFSYMKYLYKKLNTSSRSRMLLEVARLMSEKNMYGQAILTLHVTFQVYVHEYYDALDSLGDWESFKMLRNSFLDHVRSSNKALLYILSELEHTRNALAHGGSILAYTGSFQKAENLPSLFLKFDSCLENLFIHPISEV